MTDNGKDLDKEQNPQPEDNKKDFGVGPVGSIPPEKPKDLILSIKLSHETGQLTVKGPGDKQLFDEPMCFWLLEKGKDFIKAINARQSQSKIVRPNVSMTQQVREMFNRLRGY